LLDFCIFTLKFAKICSQTPVLLPGLPLTRPERRTSRVLADVRAPEISNRTPTRAEPHRSSRCGTEMTRNAKLLETAFKERGALRVLKSARARHHSAGIHCWPRIVVSTTSGAAPFSRIAQIAVTSPLCSFGGSAHASRSETSLASRMKRRLP